MNRIYIIFVSMLLLFLIIGCAVIEDVNEPVITVDTADDSASTFKTSSPTETPFQTPSPSPTLAPTPGPPNGYTLHFADEFESELIDESIWGFEIGPWPYNEELECYMRENASIVNGCLSLEARKESAQGRDYTSARLTTQSKLDMTYGYLEIRAALPTGRGTWSAIWLLPSDLRYGGYLHSGEIDIAERVGYDAKRVHTTFHTYLNNSVNGNAITAFSRMSRKDDDFHIYGFLWTEDALCTYLDGITTLRYLRSSSATPDSWPFDVPFHLILNLAIGGTWGGIKGVDDEAFPQRMRIDYVRYYVPTSKDPFAE